MSEAGLEQKYVKEAFDTNWVVPMGPNVNAFEQDLANFANRTSEGTMNLEHGSSADLPFEGGSQRNHVVCNTVARCLPIHAVDSAVTDCQPNANVEALRVFMLGKKVECRPVWKPMHKQPVYDGCSVYTNGIEEDLFKVGFCLPAGPYVTDDDVRYIVESIKEAVGC